ncbi:MAG: transketolase [Elusimicrobia bacterium CG_4_9_14_3_um_filter_62_55]|nr:MAG: transketolase [Elusimicrobia bacterium CG22_combo_CG10-13_8_21_14_all_63_91]PJA15829.1 MAG: transketolase [Elusimicrobia bacterium CG_4_10_14_0_2_um_filter_63_34]PJB25583.1 MAG: transketolase [Elusimicrobia bacterium CG_4_9_14_3_um_filter_62_55]
MADKILKHDTSSTATIVATDLDQLSVNTLRFLSVDAVQKVESGHPGLPLGAAPMAYVLWTRFLRHNPMNPLWFNRDRFVLSAGHGSALLYSLLHLSGYALPLEQLKRFRQWGSMTPGHPERGVTPGVEATTGPLGQGFGNGVGMAVAEAHLGARYNRPGFEVIDHFTYVIISDGDLMEGVASEAASLAGHLKLGKLICLYDDNRITLAASTELTFTEDRAARFAAYGWHTQSVSDGNDLPSIERALAAAREETGRPSLILVRTHIGFGSPKQDSFEAHGSPLGVEEVKKTKEKLGWPLEPKFLVPPEVERHLRRAVAAGAKAEAGYNELFSAYEKKFPAAACELRRLISGNLAEFWDADIPMFPADVKGMSTRAAAGKVETAFNSRVPELLGGSADLDPSTKTELKGAGDFESPERAEGDHQGSSGGGWSRAGRNIHFGVREHAMGAVLNGLAAHGGVLPFGATFLTFSDYMRPAIRLAALSRLHVVYVFTHDSIALGEDGPTHQPVEQLAGLRAVANLLVIRPGDANEAAAAWRVAVEARDRPVALVLSRQDVPTLDRRRFASAEGLRRGAYILSDAPKARPRLILIASGSEVGLIVASGQMLEERGIPVRLVSMPSWELFEAQTPEYRESVLPPAIRARLAVEAGVAQGWSRYIGDRGGALCVERFGASAPGATVLREYGFTVENVCARALALLDDHQ